MTKDKRQYEPNAFPPTAGYGVDLVKPLTAGLTDLALMRPEPCLVAAALAHQAHLSPEETLTNLEMARQAAEITRQMNLKTLRQSIEHPDQMSHGVIIPRAHELLVRKDDIFDPTIPRTDRSGLLIGAGKHDHLPSPDVVGANADETADITGVKPLVTPATQDPEVETEFADMMADPRHLHAAKLQEILKFAGETTDEHIVGLRQSVSTLCDTMASHVQKDQLKDGKIIDAAAIRGELLDSVVDLQGHILGIIQTMKSQSSTRFRTHDKQDITTILGEGLSELMVAASNAATRNLTPQQREIYVDLSNVVLDGIFKESKAMGKGGGHEGGNGSSMMM